MPPLRHALACIALFAAACGSSVPTAPGPPATLPPSPPDLRPGAYILALSPGRAPLPGADIPIVSMMCASTGPGPITMPQSAWIDVVVEPAENGVRVIWRGAAIDRTLSGTLQIARDGTIAGSMGGRALAQGGVAVWVTGDAGAFSDARLTGTAAGPYARGDVEGQVEFFVGQSSGSCKPMMWTLVPR